jgi:hypothetical protein
MSTAITTYFADTNSSVQTTLTTSPSLTGPQKDTSFSQSNIIILCVLFTIGYLQIIKYLLYKEDSGI